VRAGAATTAAPAKHEAAGADGENKHVPLKPSIHCDLFESNFWKICQ
jgi:hypothetical protein